MGIGTILVERGIITREDLNRAIEAQKDTGERLDRALIRLQICTASDVLKVIGEQFALPIIELSGLEVKREILDKLPAKLVYQQKCVPIAQTNGNLRIATSEPFELTAFDELRLLTGCAIELVLAEEEDLNRFIQQHYGVAGDTLDALSAAEGIDLDSPTHADGDDEASQSDLEEAQQASVIKLVNELLIEAINQRATDIHIEPFEKALKVRYRIDGILYKPNVAHSISRFRHAIVSRIKIMSHLNIAEKRRPQDGRITLRHKGREYDLRVSIIPMLFGEGVVLRILNKSAVMLNLDDLGMTKTIHDRWNGLISKPHGILLVTGPTGSGKSTTLYASLNQIVSDEIKAVTVEDPVEYNLDGVNQIPVNPKIGVTFATGLRAILRHDPDIIMIGEIRDKETATAAIQASLTGHLVFSTLHTNDAASATTRLLDMGVEPYLVSSSLEGVLAQRLVRRLCPQCCQQVASDELQLPASECETPGTYFEEVGCKACNHRGYRGRLGVFEIFTLDDHVRDMLMNNTNVMQITQYALEHKTLLPLTVDGFEKARQGITTVNEVVRSSVS